MAEISHPDVVATPEKEKFKRAMMKAAVVKSFSSFDDETPAVQAEGKHNQSNQSIEPSPETPEDDRISANGLNETVKATEQENTEKISTSSSSSSEKDDTPHQEISNTNESGERLQQELCNGDQTTVDQSEQVSQHDTSVVEISPEQVREDGAAVEQMNGNHAHNSQDFSTNPENPEGDAAPSDDQMIDKTNRNRIRLYAVIGLLLGIACLAVLFYFLASSLGSNAPVGRDNDEATAAPPLNSTGDEGITQSSGSN